MSYVCPECESANWSTSRHIGAEVFCSDCGATILEEGHGLPWKQVPKTGDQYKIEYVVEEKVPDFEDMNSSECKCQCWVFENVLSAIKKEEELLAHWNNPNVFISTTVSFTNLITNKTNFNGW